MIIDGYAYGTGGKGGPVFTVLYMQLGSANSRSFICSSTLFSVLYTLY